MKYRCLVLDHDDTVVNSTATIHFPAFEAYLQKARPALSGKFTLRDYFVKNFHPGFLAFCHDEVGLDDADLQEEMLFWRAYVGNHVPEAYPGIREILLRHKSEGGLICVVSHSLSDYILRDYEKNRLPAPDAVYGWDMPPEMRKPNPYPLTDIMRRFSLQPGEMLMLDDLKPGYDMAKCCGVPFAAAGWANDIPEIEAFMQKNCPLYFKTVAALQDYLF